MLLIAHANEKKLDVLSLPDVTVSCLFKITIRMAGHKNVSVQTELSECKIHLLACLFESPSTTLWFPDNTEHYTFVIEMSLNIYHGIRNSYHSEDVAAVPMIALLLLGPELSLD